MTMNKAILILLLTASTCLAEGARQWFGHDEWTSVWHRIVTSWPTSTPKPAEVLLVKPADYEVPATPRRYWKIVGSEVEAMTQAERDDRDAWRAALDASIEQARKDKVSDPEQMDEQLKAVVKALYKWINPAIRAQDQLTPQEFQQRIKDEL